MSGARLTDTQRRALVCLHAERWQGTRESGIAPNTAEALVRRGLATETREHRFGYHRLVWRLTAAGERAQAAELGR